MYEQNENKRLKIEKRRQEQLHNQKHLIEKFHEKKRETENLLRLSYQNEGGPPTNKVNISSPELQFNDSYMKKRVNKGGKNKQSNPMMSGLGQTDPDGMDPKMSDKSYDGDKENLNFGDNQQVINEANNE